LTINSLNRRAYLSIGRPIRRGGSSLSGARARTVLKRDNPLV